MEIDKINKICENLPFHVLVKAMYSGVGEFGIRQPIFLSNDCLERLQSNEFYIDDEDISIGRLSQNEWVVENDRLIGYIPLWSVDDLIEQALEYDWEEFKVVDYPGLKIEWDGGSIAEWHVENRANLLEFILQNWDMSKDYGYIEKCIRDYLAR